MGTLMSAGEFWTAYKPFVITFVIMAVLVFALMLLLQYARHQAEEELGKLLDSDANLYLERLENNNRLALVFRKPVLLLYKLTGYMEIGNDIEIRNIIGLLDSMKLEPRDKVEYLQKRMSFFVSTGDSVEAKASFERLSGYLHSVKADEVDRYRVLLDEGAEIIRVYLDRDVSYMDELKEKAAGTGHPVLRGVMYFRLAKLAHFKGDAQEREKYLALASETLSGTYYEEIIIKARLAPEILETK